MDVNATFAALMELLLMWRFRDIFLHDRSHLMIIEYGDPSVTHQLSECILFLLLLFIVKPPGGGGGSRGGSFQGGADESRSGQGGVD